MKQAYFRFEASADIGAGHAIRSCVLADALVERGWVCKVVITLENYDFIPALKRFQRIDPEDFYHNPPICDLLVIDHYGLDQNYEKHFRPFVKRMMVIDDLANRKHDCDVLLDQTYGRDAGDYKELVPEQCEILAGVDYVLLRKEFILLRPKAVEKRRQTTEIRRILISLGGGDSKNYTLKALEMIKQSGFKGAIDIVLGFASSNVESVKNYIRDFPCECTLYVDADMPKLMYEADLAIGAAGSSVWERCCLSLPQYLVQTAENQSSIVKEFPSFPNLEFKEFYDNINFNYQHDFILPKIDGLGIFRVMNYLMENHDASSRLISHVKICEKDIDLIFHWQQNSAIRKFSFNKESPSYEDHKKWFYEKIKNPNVVFEKIIAHGKPCGTLRLDYCVGDDFWELSWYILPEFQGKGIGTIALNFAKSLVLGNPINAFVFKENIFSQRALNKAGFKITSEKPNGFFYVY